MKFLVAFALAVACAHADVSHIVKSGDQGANIVRSDVDVQPDGFQYAVETSNGIQFDAQGSLKDAKAEAPVQVIQGQFAYPGDDGQTYKITYVADENGFQPQGAHLPTSPPIPELIQRSLAYNAAHPQAEEYPKTGARAQASAFVAPAPPAFPARQAGKFPKRF